MDRTQSLLRVSVVYHRLPSRRYSRRIERLIAVPREFSTKENEEIP